MSYDIKHGLEDVAKAIGGDGISSRGSSLVGALEKLAESNVEAARIQAEAQVESARILAGHSGGVYVTTPGERS